MQHPYQSTKKFTIKLYRQQIADQLNLILFCFLKPENIVHDFDLGTMFQFLFSAQLFSCFCVRGSVKCVLIFDNAIRILVMFPIIYAYIRIPCRDFISILILSDEVGLKCHWFSGLIFIKNTTNKLELNLVTVAKYLSPDL